LEGSGPGDWSSACVLSRPNNLICPFLQAHARRRRRRRRIELEAEGNEAAAVLLPGGYGEDVEDGVVGEDGGVRRDAVVEG
jgi:hypothetical protein